MDKWYTVWLIDVSEAGGQAEGVFLLMLNLSPVSQSGNIGVGGKGSLEWKQQN